MAKKNQNNIRKKGISQSAQNLKAGRNLIQRNEFAANMVDTIGEEIPRKMGVSCRAEEDGTIYIDDSVLLEPEQWAYLLVHMRMHLAFDQWSAVKMPGYQVDGKWVVNCDIRVWNLACNIYISRYLSDIHIEGNPFDYSFADGIRDSADEREIYYALMHLKERGTFDISSYYMDMEGLEKPVYYEDGKAGFFADLFRIKLQIELEGTIYQIGRDGEECTNPAQRAANWFINHYPLLGSIASAFQVVYDREICIRNEIAVAAISVTEKKIFVNPTARLTLSELKFVLAHEYLHAGLMHASRRQGRDPFLWNCAVDFLTNSWLTEMRIGDMPDGSLYDRELTRLSAESIYDLLIKNMRKYKKLRTYGGQGRADLLDDDGTRAFHGGMTMDEFCKSALLQGLQYEQIYGRGTIPAGLVEEIQALAVPPIPWNVELGTWLDLTLSEGEKKRTYFRASRRQSCTPEIPRAGYQPDIVGKSKVFGAIIDTSGSVNLHMLEIALGAIVGYSREKNVGKVRVVCCDAVSYDLGWLSAEELAGRVKIKGRGGTVLQPAVDLLEQAEDFPTDAPILVLTDGWVEETLKIRREHAFLIPKGRRLPFKSKGAIFYFSEN